MSTVIVFAVAIVVAAWVNRDLIRIKIASVYVRVAPKAGEAGLPGHGHVAAFTGDAPWALSALPECLTQVSKSTGSAEYVQAHLPAHSVRVSAPAHLMFADCSIALFDDEALVTRGADRFRIPPQVQFYHSGDSLAVVRESAQGVELRVYAPVQP